MKQRRPLKSLKDALPEPFIIHELSKKTQEHQLPLSNYYDQEMPIQWQPQDKFREEAATSTVIVIDL